MSGSLKRHVEGNSDETQVTGGNWANRVLSKRSTGAGQAAGGRAANGRDDNDDAQIDSRRAGRSPGRRLNAPRPPPQPRGPRPSPMGVQRGCACLSPTHITPALPRAGEDIPRDQGFAEQPLPSALASGAWAENRDAP